MKSNSITPKTGKSSSSQTRETNGGVSDHAYRSAGRPLLWPGKPVHATPLGSQVLMRFSTAALSRGGRTSSAADLAPARLHSEVESITGEFRATDAGVS